MYIFERVLQIKRLCRIKWRKEHKEFDDRYDQVLNVR